MSAHDLLELIAKIPLFAALEPEVRKPLAALIRVRSYSPRQFVVWEGEPGDTRTLTYAQLAVEVERLAAGLLALGVRRGDVVGIYMPNLVEAFTAIHACNRIGAVYTVLFSGFGEEAVASRLQASRALVVVVADAIHRRKIGRAHV